jgi:flavodoxin I
MKLANTLILLQATASAEFLRFGLPRVAVSDGARHTSDDGAINNVVVLYGEPTPRHHAGAPDSNRTEAVAKMVAAEAGVEATFFEKPYSNYDFDSYDAILVGAPTYNTGATDYRSNTDWDDWLYDELPNIDVRGKHVAIFGSGKPWYPKYNDDGSLKSCCSGYGDNFGDAMGELYDRFAEAGATMFGFIPASNDFENGGYNYTKSKFIRNDMFMGMMFDQKSQEELSPGRAQSWVAQLREEGFFGSSGEENDSHDHDSHDHDSHDHDETPP